MFPRAGLYDDSGALRERWGQEGSALVAVSDNTLIDEVMYTVTVGKRFFLKTLVVKDDASSASCYARLKDTSVGADLLTVSVLGAGNEENITLDAPVVFLTEVYVGTGSAVNVTIIGWEEDL